MEGCLLIGGKAPPRKYIESRIPQWDIVVAADSGLNHAEALGLVPSDIVGDFDSVGPNFRNRYSEIRIHRHSPEKDETDTELGIDLLRSMGVDVVHIVGGGGGRLDHLYAVLSLFHRSDPPNHWYTHREHIVLVSGFLGIELPPHKRVSLFPLGDRECRMKSRGLKWPLDDLEWKVGNFGISNVTTEKKIQIEMLHGQLIMMYDLSSEDRL